ncbi:unnamed protein product, partial [Prorocentrum cordatum]
MPSPAATPQLTIPLTPVSHRSLRAPSDDLDLSFNYTRRRQPAFSFGSLFEGSTPGGPVASPWMGTHRQQVSFSDDMDLSVNYTRRRQPAFSFGSMFEGSTPRGPTASASSPRAGTHRRQVGFTSPTSAGARHHRVSFHSTVDAIGGDAEDSAGDGGASLQPTGWEFGGATPVSFVARSRSERSIGTSEWAAQPGTPGSDSVVLARTCDAE